VKRLLLALVALLVFSCNTIDDPVSVGRAVHGIVYDAATQKPVEGVRIEIAGRATATAANGSYYLADTPPGMQALTASKSAYATYVTDVQVTTGLNQKKFYVQPVY
jgi:hypothetical protein